MYDAHIKCYRDVVGYSVEEVARNRKQYEEMEVRFIKEHRKEAIMFWIVSVVLVTFWLFSPSDNHPREGDRCGPNHHYVYVYADIYGNELSCEDDDR
jgi:hypothetical protein